MFEHGADRLVHRERHGVVDAPHRVGGVHEPGDVVHRRLHGRMHGVEGEVEEERPRPVPFDERHRFASERVRQVRLLRDMFPAAENLPAPHRALLDLLDVWTPPRPIRKQDQGHARPEVVRAPQEPEELVEPPLQGMELGSGAQVPLADRPGRVARGLQAVRQRRFLKGERFVGRPLVTPHAEPLLIPPGQQARPSRAAPRSGHVPVREPHPAGREGVQVRRRDVLDAVETHIRVAEIVGHDQQDVGPAVFGHRGGCRTAHRDG